MLFKNDMGFLFQLKQKAVDNMSSSQRPFEDIEHDDFVLSDDERVEVSGDFPLCSICKRIIYLEIEDDNTNSTRIIFCGNITQYPAYRHREPSSDFPNTLEYYCFCHKESPETLADKYYLPINHIRDLCDFSGYDLPYNSNGSTYDIINFKQWYRLAQMIKMNCEKDCEGQCLIIELMNFIWREFNKAKPVHCSTCQRGCYVKLPIHKDFLVHDISAVTEDNHLSKFKSNIYVCNSYNVYKCSDCPDISTNDYGRSRITINSCSEECRGECNHEILRKWTDLWKYKNASKK